MVNKLGFINSHLSHTNTDFFFITESWLKSAITNSMINFKHYDIIRQDRHNSSGGGVALLHKNYLRLNRIELDCEVTLELLREDKFEYICVDLIDGKSIVRLCCVYIPPSSSTCRTTLSLICTSLQKLIIPTNPFFLFGDFNLPNINWEFPTSLGNPAHDLFLSFTLSNSLTEHILQPTHKRGNTLDLLFSNLPAQAILLSYSVEAPLSSTCDHNLITLQFELKNKVSFLPNKLLRNFAKANFDDINIELNTINWYSVYNSCPNFQSFYNLFVDILQNTINNHVSYFQELSSNRPKYPKHIKALLNEKILFYKMSKLDTSYKKAYKIKCKEYEKAVSIWNDKKELKLCANPSSKKFYKFVNQKLSSRSTIPPLVDNNQVLLTSDLEKANFLNTEFQNFFVKDNCRNLQYFSKHAPQMPSCTISKKDISNALSSMKDKLTRTPEEIPSFFVKRCSSSLIEPLFMIFNLSLQHCSIPLQWKQAIVIPVFKKGSRNRSQNYRPISLTSCLCRLFESILSEKILSHLLSNNLLSSKQFGFLPNRSSSSQLLSCLQKWSTSFSNNLSTNILYTDIRKAFDSVCHSKLINTLHAYKLHSSVVNWISNFLTDRYQQVAIKESLSSPVHAFSGVPQGSIIGPILFNIYYNDVTDCETYLGDSGSIMLYADDAKVFSTDPKKLQDSLDFVDTWLKSRQLQLAYDKCFLLTISKPRHNNNSTFFLSNHEITSEAVAKDLGIFVTQDLKWEVHVNYLCKTGSLISYQIRKSIKTRNIWTMMKLYTTYVRPKLEFNSPVWSPYLKQDIIKLEAIQRSYTKSACLRCSIPFSSYRDRLTKLSLKTLEYRRLVFDLICLFKIIKGQSDLLFSDYFKERKVPYSLRGSSFKVEPKVRYKISQCNNIFFVRTPPVWNALPSDITNVTNVGNFKHKLNNFDLTKIFNFTV